MLDPWNYELGGRYRDRITYGPAREDALHRSWVLLNQFLTPEQHNSLLTMGYFYTGKRRRGRKVYIIAIAGSINVCAGRQTYCSHPMSGYGSVPMWDKILAQYLAIQTGHFFSFASPWRRLSDPLARLPKVGL